MSTPSPHSRAPDTLGFLDLRPTLCPAPPQTIYQPPIPLPYLLLADRLGELYEIVFPEQAHYLDEVAAWDSDEAVGVAVERFLGRVNELFPVHDEIWEIDLEEITWRLGQIPVIPLGYDLWHEEWDVFTEPAPYLLHLCYSRQEEDDTFAALYPDYPLPHCLQPPELVDALRELPLPTPLDALPDLIEILTQSTGNVWLDVGVLALAEGEGYPPWTADEVAWLTEQWQAAKPVWDRIYQLLEWREVDAKLAAVRQALLDAQRRRG